MPPKIPQELRVLRFPLKLLEVTGLWGDRRNVWRYIGAVVFLALVVIFPKVVFGSGRSGFDSIARSLAELIFYCEVCISSGVFAIRRGSFEKLVAILSETVERYNTDECSDEIWGFNRKMEIHSKRYCKWIACCVTGYLGSPVVLTCVHLLLQHGGERDDFILNVELQFFWMDIRQNLFHYVIFVILCALAIFSAAYQSILKGSVFLIVMQYGAKLFDMVSFRLRGLEKITSKQERTKALGEIIDLHNAALEYTSYLEDTLCFVMINQILNCILIWCLMMFYLSTNFGPNAASLIILFNVLMAEMVSYCVIGNKLSEEAAAVGEAAYNYPWYNESVAMQKDLQLIMVRAQKPTGITAAKFYFVNIERLGLVVQASYSYYLILKNQF